MPFISLFDNWWVLYMFNLIPSASEYTNMGILAKTICQSGTFHIVRELALNQYLLFKHLQNHTQVSVFTDLNITSLYSLPSAGWHQAVLSVALFKKGFVFLKSLLKMFLLEHNWALLDLFPGLLLCRNKIAGRGLCVLESLCDLEVGY